MMPESDRPQPEPVLARWFRGFEQTISEGYARLHKEALEDPQRAGHAAEATWVNFLKNWLPSAYEVVARKYIVPEIGNEKFETDIIVLNPSYPSNLRADADILAGGVAAAFSVRLTLDAGGIRDGVKRAVALRRALNPRFGTPRDEITGAFPVGMLAHSHDWKAQNSTPSKNILINLQSLDQELVAHPRESLDYLCVSDLGIWSTSRAPYLPPGSLLNNPATGRRHAEGIACTSVMPNIIDEPFNPLASLIAQLYIRLSYIDRTLRPLADNFRATGALGGGGGQARIWGLQSVYSDEVRRLLPSRGLQLRDSDWGTLPI